MIVAAAVLAAVLAWVGLMLVVRSRNPVHRLATPWEIELARIEMEMALMLREIGRRLVPVVGRLSVAFRGLAPAARSAEQALGTFRDALAALEDEFLASDEAAVNPPFEVDSSS